ncbi:MAG: metal-dependent protease of the PAD1/JAB1 superfamily, partial [Clostridiales bacterium]|nr:metal-dependent protease of the PAD1/JAB1 superfamily [Clostridiales bacterium]
MDQDFNIEIESSESETAGQVQLPMNILLIGEVENDDLKVYIKQDVYKALEKYALEDTEHERGTIILGEYCEELGKKHVVISNYIEAKYTDASASTLTFTHETWEYVHKVHDSDYPDTKIVGWQHTHPGYGIFLSNYDMFIQENFFNLPFQVAYVIDPKQGIRGFFQWKNGKVEKLKGFYIYDDVGKTIKIDNPPKKKEEKEDTKASKPANKAVIAVMAVLCVITLILAVSTISLMGKYREQQAIQEEIRQSIEVQNQVIKNQNEVISQFESSDEPDQKEEEEDSPADEIKLIKYEVKAGESLSSICRDNNIDYNANKNVILGVNGIESP